jgi:hypothetical protein
MACPPMWRAMAIFDWFTVTSAGARQEKKGSQRDNLYGSPRSGGVVVGGRRWWVDCSKA